MFPSVSRGPVTLLVAGSDPLSMAPHLFMFLLLLVTSSQEALGILQNSQPPSLCEAPGCSCQRASLLHCKCSHKQELIMQSSGYDYLPDQISMVIIEGCAKLTVTSRCLERLNGLRSVHLKRLSLLELQENSFSWGSSEIQESYPYPGINVTIEDSIILTIPSHTFRGMINSINLLRVNVTETVKPYAFSNLAGIERVDLLGTNVKEFEQQAFKKFITDYLNINGGYFGTVPSLAINDVQVRKDFRIQNVHIQRLRSLAVRVNGPTGFRIQGCRIESMEGDVFRVSTQGPVFIEDNRFDEVGVAPFVGVAADPRFVAQSGKQEIIFENNTLLTFLDGALTFNTSTLKPTIDRVIITKPCTCGDIDAWATRLIRYTDFIGPVPNARKLMWCRKGKWDIVADTFYGKTCGSKASTLYMMVFLLVGGFLLLALIGLAFFCFYRRRLKRYINVPTNSNRHSTYSSGSNHIMVVPDGKTYRETELHVIVERAEPITEFKPQQPPIITELNSKD